LGIVRIYSANSAFQHFSSVSIQMDRIVQAKIAKYNNDNNMLLCFDQPHRFQFDEVDSMRLLNRSCAYDDCGFGSINLAAIPRPSPICVLQSNSPNTSNHVTSCGSAWKHWSSR